VNLDFPEIPTRLVEVLESRFPERWPNKKMTDRDIWIRAGVIEVIALLKTELERQQKKGQPRPCA
jgi:hypothetical protein